MKKVLIIGAGAMGAAFSFPLLDNNNKVTLTEPYNTKLINQIPMVMRLISVALVRLYTLQTNLCHVVQESGLKPIHNM